MFYWSFHPHRTPSHPFKVPNNYIPFLLRIAPIIVEFGPCCYPENLPTIRFPGMVRNESEEDNESFYREIEERIMRVISDDDEEEELKRGNRAPLVSINGERPQLFPIRSDARSYGMFDAGMRQWQATFVCGDCRRRAWLAHELEKVRRSALATGRKGTGVFIPRYVST